MIDDTLKCQLYILKIFQIIYQIVQSITGNQADNFVLAASREFSLFLEHVFSGFRRLFMEINIISRQFIEKLSQIHGF